MYTRVVMFGPRSSLSIPTGTWREDKDIQIDNNQNLKINGKFQPSMFKDNGLHYFCAVFEMILLFQNLKFHKMIYTGDRKCIYITRYIITCPRGEAGAGI